MSNTSRDTVMGMVKAGIAGRIHFYLFACYSLASASCLMLYLCSRNAIASKLNRDSCGLMNCTVRYDKLHHKPDLWN